MKGKRGKRGKAGKGKAGAGIDVARLKRDAAYFIESIIYSGTGQSLTAFQREWLGILQKHRRVVLMCFRSAGKTRQLFVHFFLWQAITRPNTQYLIISKTLPQAKEVLKDIRITILTNPVLKTLVPKNRNQTWSTTELELSNYSRIISKAYNDNVRGLHVDGVGTDELGEYEDHEVLKKAVLPTIRAKRGFWIGTGTPKSELDLLHEIESDPGFSSVYFDRYPAEGGKGNLFEQRYPDTRISHRDGAVFIEDRDTGEVIESYSNMTWSQEFLLRPVSTKDKLFPDSMVAECVDPTESFIYGPRNMKTYWMGLDFAMSAQSGADYTVITILEKSPGDPRLRLVFMERFKGMDYTIQKERIKELADKYCITKALGDENSFGKTFIYDLKAEGVPVDGFKFSAMSQSKNEIIKALRDQFEKKGFILPGNKDDVKTVVMMNVLLDELTKFGIVFDMRTKTVKFEGLGRYDDCVVSLGLANYIARHVTMGLFSAIKGSERRKFNPFIVR